MGKTISKPLSPAKRRKLGRAWSQFLNDNPQFKDIAPRFPPSNVVPVEPIGRNQLPDLKSTARRPSSGGQIYPAPTPKNPPMRTVGEDSISTERVTLSVRMRFNPLRGLTPDRLVQYLEQFWIGFFRMAAVTWDKMELRNARLKGVVAKRKKAVARHGWEIATVQNIPDGMEQLAEQQQKALTDFYNNITVTDAVKPDQQGGLALLARQMMDAQCKYYAVHEIVWQPSPEGLSAQFVFCPLWWFEGVTGKLRYLDNEFQVYGRDMMPAEWLVTCGEGLMEAASVCYIFMSLTLNDWLGYCEKFGQPFIDAATSASPGSSEWEALKTYVENFGPDGGGVRSQGATLNLLESKGSAGNDTYEKMVEHMQREITIIFRGGDLSTQKGQSGQAGASLQGEESDVIESDDCTLIEETLALQVSRFVIDWTFGSEAPVLAYLKFNRSDKQNVDQDLKIDEFLAGLKDSEGRSLLGVASLLERYGRSMPADDEDRIEAPQKLSPPNPNDPGAGNRGFANAQEMAMDLAATLHEMIMPILQRLEAIGRIDDPAIRQHMIEKLLKDFPQISNAIKADNSLAKKLSPILSDALITGLKNENEK